MVQLMQQFVPRSRVRICRNECTRSTPLDPKLMFCFVLQCLGAFGSILLLYDTRFKTGQTVVINAKVQATKLHQNFFSNKSTLSTPSGPKLMFWCVSQCGPFRYCTKLGAKWAELGQLMQKFVPPSRFRISRNEHTQSTLQDHKLMFWRVLYYLGPFGIVQLSYETRCKTGRTSAKVCNTKSRRNFSQRTHLIHPIGP